MSKKSKILIPLIIIIIISVYFGINNFKGAKQLHSSEAIEIQLDKGISVSVDSIKVGNISKEIFSIGKITPSITYSANAKISGEVNDILVDIGDFVKKDDVLFTMVSDSYSADKSSKLLQTSNQLKQSKDSLDIALDNYNKEQILYDSGASSKDTLDKLKTIYDNARISYDNALSSLNSVEISFNNTDDSYVIKSPSNGIIVSSTVEKGMFANNQNGMTVIVADPLIIESSIPSKYINQLKVNQAVDIFVNSIERSYNGKISSISYSAVNGSFPVEIEILNKDDYVYSGMYAELKIKTETKENSKIIPLKSLISENNKNYIFLAQENVAKKLEVNIGITNEGFAELLTDVNEKESVVTTGKEYLEDGSKIKIN